MTANDPPITDVHAALLARRYPPVFVELHFDIRAPAPGIAPEQPHSHFLINRRGAEAQRKQNPIFSSLRLCASAVNSCLFSGRYAKNTVPPPNTGRYVLSIRNGKPTVQRGGTGHIRLDIDAFTVLYHNRATPAELRQTRRLTAPDEDLAALTRAFAPSPSSPAPNP